MLQNILRIIFAIISLTIIVVFCSPFTDSHKTDPGTPEDAKLAGPWKAFISYRRSFSRHLARLNKVLLQLRNVPTFIDVEDLGAGHWDEQILSAITNTSNFIMVLSNGTLDRCIGDVNYTDFLHREIKTAVDAKRNIIPIFDEYTHPKADFSPEIEEMMQFQGVEWNHSMVNATIDRLISYFIP